jgi:aromatic ring-opening dioxygenase catalytic subunit (LigB family)
MAQPAIFFGHGNPMNALLHNRYTERWRRLGEQTPGPKAILSVAAHWFVPETAVTISTAPRTIHDFGGFPRKLNAAASTDDDWLITNKHYAGHRSINLRQIDKSNVSELKV